MTLLGLALGFAAARLTWRRAWRWGEFAGYMAGCRDQRALDREVWGA